MINDVCFILGAPMPCFSFIGMWIIEWMFWTINNVLCYTFNFWNDPMFLLFTSILSDTELRWSFIANKNILFSTFSGYFCRKFKHSGMYFKCFRIYRNVLKLFFQRAVEMFIARSWYRFNLISFITFSSASCE